MELLITLIGNAAVDPVFRKRFLDDPVDTIDRYGFRLTKCDFEMMVEVFGNLTDKQKDDFNQAFDALQKQLYAGLKKNPCPAPCYWSIVGPPECRPKPEGA